eukprot:1834389-Karenia_brevis.AAC.1
MSHPRISRSEHYGAAPSLKKGRTRKNKRTNKQGYEEDLASSSSTRPSPLGDVDDDAASQC